MKLDLSVLSDDLREAMLSICSLVDRAGGRALMVGGSVRDLILGVKEVKDVDLEVYGLEPEVLQRVLASRFLFDSCGLSFGVLKIKHVDIDVSLPRRESKRGTGHRGFLVDSDPHLSISEAASRRDFTINAMYYDPLVEVFEDPYRGLEDLNARRLRHVSAKFVEDPLRVLRGMQFIARFDLEAAPETIALCRTIGMEGLACERLWEEWGKFLLKGKALSKGLDFLVATNWIAFFPELSDIAETFTWLDFSRALDAFARLREKFRNDALVLGLATLGRFLPSLDAVRSFLSRLTNEERILVDVPRLLDGFTHAEKLSMSALSSSDVLRLAVRVGRIDRVVRLGEILGVDFAALGKAANDLGVLNVAPQPLLMGRDLIAMGYKPSALFKKYLDACFEAQLDGKFTTHEGACAYFRNVIGEERKTSSSLN